MIIPHRPASVQPLFLRESPFKLEQLPEIMRKKGSEGGEGKAEDAGGLTPVMDGNAAL